MNTQILGRLATLNSDYQSASGSMFGHFYCPILYRDEVVPLFRAHIENRAFRESSSEWTVQRKDVDSFYGSRFEAEFVRLEERHSVETQDVLGNRALKAKLRPKILADENSIGYFLPRGEVPNHFTALRSVDPLLPPVVALKISEDEMARLVESRWEIEVEFDVRIHAFVSLLKAAHLANFHLIGYRYALSAAGHFVGHDWLGKFFLNAQHASRQEVEDAAVEHFDPVKGMVRPVEKHLGLRGTVVDRHFFVCRGSSGKPWATVTLIRAGGRLHGVLLPSSDRVDSIVTFLDFLGNDNETLAMSVGIFMGRNHETPWRMDKKFFRIKWPKAKNIRFR